MKKFNVIISVSTVIALIVSLFSFSYNIKEPQEIMRAAYYLNDLSGATYYFVLYSDQTLQVQNISRNDCRINDNEFIDTVSKTKRKQIGKRNFQDLIDKANSIHGKQIFDHIDWMCGGRSIELYYKGEAFCMFYHISTSKGDDYKSLQKIVDEMLVLSPMKRDF